MTGAEFILLGLTALWVLFGTTQAGQRTGLWSQLAVPILFFIYGSMKEISFPGYLTYPDLLICFSPVLIVGLFTHFYDPIRPLLYPAQAISIALLLKGGIIRDSLPLVGMVTPVFNFAIHFFWALLAINTLRLFKVFSILPHVFIFSMSGFFGLLFYLSAQWPVYSPLAFFLFVVSGAAGVLELNFPKREKRPELILSFYGFCFLVLLVTCKIKGMGVLIYSIPIIFIIHPILFICYLLISSFIVSGLHRESKGNNREIIRHYWRVTPKNIALFFLFLNFNIQFLVLLRHFQVHGLTILAAGLLGVLPLLNFGYRMFLSHPDKLPDAPGKSGEIHILGLGISNISRENLLIDLENRLINNQKTFIVTPDTLAILRSQTDKEYFQNICEADYRIADGVGVVWGSNMVGQPVTERLPGIEIFQDICQIAARNQKKVFLLGAQKRVVEEAAFKLVQSIPGLKIVGFHDGFFDSGSDIEKNVLDEIQSLKPDILFVAMGVPRQENWIARHKESLPSTLFMGIGGSFDVLSGKLKRAPLRMQALGLEWLYRLYKEPSRIFKILKIPLFIFKVIEFNLETSTHRPGP